MTMNLLSKQIYKFKTDIVTQACVCRFKFKIKLSSKLNNLIYNHFNMKI